MLNDTELPETQNAAGFLHEMSADEKTREIARIREKTLLDWNSAINFAEREGEKRGEQKKEQEMLARLRENGFTEEQLRKIFGVWFHERKKGDLDK